jgi:hypothetical protein
MVIHYIRMLRIAKNADRKKRGYRGDYTAALIVCWPSAALRILTIGVSGIFTITTERSLP